MMKHTLGNNDKSCSNRRSHRISFQFFYSYNSSNLLGIAFVTFASSSVLILPDSPLTKHRTSARLLPELSCVKDFKRTKCSGFFFLLLLSYSVFLSSIKRLPSYVNHVLQRLATTPLIIITKSVKLAASGRARDSSW